MKQAKNRVLVMLVLAAILFGAAVTASILSPAGWLIVAFFIVGALIGGQLIGSIVTYVQTRAKERLAALWAQKTKSEAFAEFARQAKANAAAHAAPPAANTEEGDES